MTERIRHAAPTGSSAPEDAGLDALPNRPLEQGRPAEVQPARGRAKHGPAGRFGPRVEPQLERPVLADRGVRAQECRDHGEGIAGLGEHGLGLGELVAGHPLEGGREDVVHRLEVVVDEAAGGAHLGRHVANGGRREALASGHRERGIDDRLPPPVGGHPGHASHSRTILRKCPIARYHAPTGPRGARQRGPSMIRTTPFHERTSARNETGPLGALVELPGRAALPDVREVRVHGDPERRGFVRHLAAVQVPLQRARRGALSRRCPRPRHPEAAPSASAHYTLWCDDRGFVIEDGVLLRVAEHEYLLTAAEPNLAYFQGLAGGLDVAIEDVTEEWGILSIQGPRSREILRLVAPAIADLGYFG